MEKLEKLYEGKAKQLYATDDPEVLWVEYKNSATAGDGEKNVIATLEELTKRQPEITAKQLWLSGRQVGRDVIGSMTNILLFVYISGSVPSLLLYLGNQWSFKETIEQHLSLEFLRVIAGSLGIVLSISTISVLFFLTVRRLKR